MSPTVELIARIADLEAENARLQAQVEEAERELAEHGCRKVEREAFRARDRYKALAERRKEALEECNRLAIERITTADAAVKVDVYAADALMGIATIARRAAIEEEGR